MPRSYYMTAGQAAAALGVTLPTLYAYVSRRQIRSEAVPAQPRARRYYRDDVERLMERKEARRDPVAAAARGLHWGGPVLESGITLIHEGRFYYRGRDAATLARSATLEEIASLLWAVERTEPDRLFAQAPALPARRLAQLRDFSADPLTRMQVALPIAATADLAAGDLRPAAVQQTGARIVRLLTSSVADHHPPMAAHMALRSAWGARAAGAADAIRAALVLSADHELNISAFTARCAASAGASPYDVVSAALATFKGFKHGGASEQVQRLFAEMETAKNPSEALAKRLRRGERLPGFGHRLYPKGDPRSQLLLRLCEAGGNPREWKMIRTVWKIGSDLVQEFPNLDFALAAMARVYRLPDNAGVVLFAIGRTIGWIAHAIEEYAAGEMIRPRARYNGPLPWNEPGQKA